MEIGTITSLISSVGFPIVCCIYLFYINQKSDERHAEEIKSISEAVNNNTLAINHLIDKLGGDHREA